MTRNYITQCFDVLKEVKERHKAVKSGIYFNFKQEIEPFLTQNEKIVHTILTANTDQRFTPIIQKRVHKIFLELLMSCHSEHMSKKIFIEQTKYVQVWLNHIEKENLL